jgi:hypothetical protein
VLVALAAAPFVPVGLPVLLALAGVAAGRDRAFVLAGRAQS